MNRAEARLLYVEYINERITKEEFADQIPACLGVEEVAVETMSEIASGMALSRLCEYLDPGYRYRKDRQEFRDKIGGVLSPLIVDAMKKAYKEALSKLDQKPEVSKPAVESVSDQFRAAIGPVTHTWRVPIVQTTTPGVLDDAIKRLEPSGDDPHFEFKKKFNDKAKTFCRCDIKTLMSTGHDPSCPEKPR